MILKLLSTGGISLFAWLLLTGTSAALTPNSASLPLARLMVLPFKSDFGVSVKAQVYAAVKDELTAVGFEALPDSLVQAALRQFRVRDTSRLNIKEAQQLSRELGTPWIFLGSVDYYTAEEQKAEVGISARLVNATNGEVVWAGAQFASGADYAGVLGLGAISSTPRLAELETHKFIRAFRRWWLEHPERLFELDPQISTAQRVLVLPFDNLTPTLSASLWVNNALLKTLIERGYRLIEPGMVQDQIQFGSAATRGEIDLITLASLADVFPCTYLITGAIFQCSSENDATLGEVPRVELALRVLDNSGQPVYARQLERRGTDFIKVFHWGLIRAPGELIQAVLREMLEDFPPTLKTSAR